MIARDPKRTVDYVLEEDRTAPPEARTTWKLGVLTARAQAAIAEATVIYDAKGRLTGLKNATHTLLTLAYGLREVSGLKDEAGAEIPLEWTDGPGGPMVADGFLDRLPPAVRLELADEIAKLNMVTKEDKKN